MAELRIEGHELVVIAQDGANVKPKTVDKLISAAGLTNFKIGYSVYYLVSLLHFYDLKYFLRNEKHFYTIF